jgi:hypothetical protein
MTFTQHKQKPYTFEKKYFVTGIFYLDLSICAPSSVEVPSPFCLRGGTFSMCSENVHSLSLQ